MYPLIRYANTLLTCGLIVAAANLAAGNPSPGPTTFVYVAPGSFQPLLKDKSQITEVKVDAFLLEDAPVTNADYLRFVQENPRWQRSHVAPLFADSNYLAHWKSDLELGDFAPPQAPVVNVSWFAARAYARWNKARLPSTNEWERVAQAGFDYLKGRDDPAWVAAVNQWLAIPTPSAEPNVKLLRPNVLGLYDVNLLVWEWVEDFNSAMATGDSRGDSSLDRALFCGAGAIGARDPSDYTAFLRAAMRSSLRADYCLPNLGFRCARNP